MSLHCYRDLTVSRCDSVVTYALVRNLELCQFNHILILVLTVPVNQDELEAFQKMTSLLSFQQGRSCALQDGGT